MSQPIKIVEYDPRWPAMFEEARAEILSGIGQFVVAVEHVGSTSVPGLGAKPVIDMMVGIRSLDDAPQCVGPLAALGYEYGPEHEAIMPERRYFRRGRSDASTHHIHMVEPASDFWERHLLFRDYLRAHTAAAREYEELKRRLAALHGSDRGAYTDDKTDFIESIIRKAIISDG